MLLSFLTLIIDYAHGAFPRRACSPPRNNGSFPGHLQSRALEEGGAIR